MENKYAEKLVKEYSKKGESKLDQLKTLDRKVKTPARVFAYIFGTIAALILGTGMTLAMNIIGGTTVWMIIGIVVGVIGIVMASINYPIYKKMLGARKEKYAQEILTRSNELLND